MIILTKIQHNIYFPPFLKKSLDSELKQEYEAWIKGNMKGEKPTFSKVVINLIEKGLNNQKVNVDSSFDYHSQEPHRLKKRINID